MLAASFLMAHLAVLFAPAPMPSNLLVILPSLLVALAGLFLRGTWPRCTTIVGIVFMLGVLNASIAVQQGLSQRLQPSLKGQKLWVQGRIATLPRHQGDNLSFLLGNAEVPGQPGLRVPRRIQVNWYRSARDPVAGEWWRLHLRLRDPVGPLNPGGKDVDAWYFRAGIGARASVVSGEAHRLQALPHGLPVLRMRGQLARKIRSALDGHPMSGIVMGLAVGIRDDISSSQWRLLSATGTGHLVAISGLHVGLISGLAFMLARFGWGLSVFLSSRLAPIDAARPIAMLVGIAYAMLAGFALPTQRALIMLALWYGAGALRRPACGVQILSLSMMLCLVIDPLGVLGPGFWLSFGAVATLILATRRRAAGRLRELWLTQCKVFAGIAPISFAIFGKVSLIAPCANLIMIPLFGTVLIPLVLIGSFATIVWPWSGEHLLRACAGLLSAVWPFLQYLGSSDLLEFSRTPSHWLILSCTVTGLLLLVPSWPGKRLLLLSLVLAVFHARRHVPLHGGLEATVLDVGHAMSVVVNTHKHSLVYDLGQGSGAHSDVERIIIPFLRHKGIARPDVLILSHDDARHLGDAAQFLRRHPAMSVMSGAPVAAGVRLGAGRVEACRPGKTWEWDGVVFEILHPGREIIWEDDSSSCVLRITSEALSLLLTGDLGVKGERKLLRRYRGLRVDVVVGLAHGSAGASSAELVAGTRAQVAVVSTREGNPWGLPAPSVRDRWRGHGATLINTGEKGAVTIHSDRDWRYGWERRSKIWHRQ